MNALVFYLTNTVTTLIAIDNCFFCETENFFFGEGLTQFMSFSKIGTPVLNKRLIQTISLEYDMAGSETQGRLLDAAEHLFAMHGLEATSLRAITTEANVNLASVNYHFGSKEALIQAVFARRIGPINTERLRLLSLAEVAGDPPDLRAILDAFIRPAVSLAREMGPQGRDFMALAGRMYTLPPDYRKLLMNQFDEVFERFGRALGSALPHLSQPTLLWRFFFMVGTMIMSLVGSDLMAYRSGGAVDPGDVDATIDQMMAFLAAGLKAPDIHSPPPELLWLSTG
jgi:AcrR family transcriptional regulator